MQSVELQYELKSSFVYIHSLMFFLGTKTKLLFSENNFSNINTQFYRIRKTHKIEYEGKMLHKHNHLGRNMIQVNIFTHINEIRLTNECFYCK